jgi:hypothetical protein
VPITLSSRFVRRTALAGAAATLSIALAACGANFNAQTAKPYQAAEGTNADSGSIKVRNMLVLATEDGKGELHSAIVNDGSTDDTLVKIEQAPPGTHDGQAGGDQPGQVKFSEFAPIDLKAGTSTMLPPAAGEATASATPTQTPTADPTATPTESPTADPGSQGITVTGGKPGQMINVVITFGQAGPITTYIPVLTENHYSPTPQPAE